jgi:hypothetical protein
MHIAFTMAPGRGDTDLLLSRFAIQLARQGRRTSGTVQINTERDAGPCDMDVKVLPDGPVICISQRLGSGSTGCRLDPAALETAVGLVEASFATAPDCLIVNKFGKHEAEGRGFRPLIADALSRDIPVLVGLNALNAPAFHAFTEGTAVALPPTLPALTAWFAACRRDRAA